MPDEQVVQATLRRVARRLWLWRAVRRLLRATAMVSAAAAGMLLASRAGLGQDVRATVILAVAGLGLVVAMVPGLRRVTAAQAAQTLDATFGLGERFVTAVECLGQTGGMPRLVVQDAARWSYRLDLRRVQRAPLGRDAWLALVGVAAASVVWIYASGPAGLHPASDIQADVTAMPLVPATAAQPAAKATPSTDARSEVRSGLRQALGLDTREAATRASQGAPSRQSVGARADLASDSPTPRGSVGAPGAPPDAGAASMAPHMATRASERAARQGLAAGLGSGAVGQAPGVSGKESPGVGLAADPGTQRTVGGAGLSAHPETPTKSGDARSPGSPGALRVDAVFARMPVPPTLRQYILRYFDELGTPANGEGPS